MDPLQKLRLLGQHMALEPAEDADAVARPTGVAAAHQVAPCGHTPAALQQSVTLGIQPAVTPGGKHMPLLKTLLTSACERDCYYCPFRARRNFRRVTFKPEEMARAFMALYQGGAAEGLFLSSGIAGGGVRTQDRLLDTAAILRRRHAYRGYLHLKLMPGIEREQLLQAMHLADRISINLEAPNTARLQSLAPQKTFFEELLQPLQWAEDMRRTLPPRQTQRGRWPSLVTQFVVGGAGESDREILTTTAYMTQHLRLQRVYFSAFHPVSDTPMAEHPAENPWREHRLYQAAHLLRDYGFVVTDLPFLPDSRLPLDVDPKLGWAQQHLQDTPVELLRADRQQLLQVPGIGPKSAEAILQARRHTTFRALNDLQRLGVRAARAAPFIVLNGQSPVRQLSLFAGM
ncbi:MAG: radical SAM protein [Candidatus Tectomicrobia bacterium]|uniref:Radical SAM protein n=1 Tax=Tectimicrobiota bacterium TaxID=2528274 RepID=A0A938B2P8_UNCTE|nr:radical SAM protein [Candidatus Tectomicrobia bacterium]